MAEPVLRIFSDLHFLEGSCRVHQLAQLRPLLDGADALLVNGDSIDTQNNDSHGTGQAEIKAFFAAHVARTTFLTGNHDPDISPLHELDLAGGTLWVTHGDIFFDDMTPWSHHRPEIVRRIAAATARLPAAERVQLEARLRVYREISFGLPRERDLRERGVLSMVKRFWLFAFPPRCTLAVLRCWLTAHHRAADLAAAHRPQARFIIHGHTHRTGVWRHHDGRVVINTGSFCAPFAGQMVECQGGRLHVRPIVERGGEFRPGAPTVAFTLAVPALLPLSATS